MMLFKRKVLVSYDPIANASNIYLAGRFRKNYGFTYSCITGGVFINLDFDTEKRLVGIEVLAARQTLPLQLLASREGSEVMLYFDYEIQVSYDQNADAAQIYLDGPIVDATAASTYSCDPARVKGTINLHFDAEERLIAVGLLAATEKLPRQFLPDSEAP